MAKAQRENAAAEAVEQPPTGGTRFVRYCLVLLLAGAVILAWVSLLTFSRTDPPSPDVYPARYPVANAMGAIGAYLGYMLRYWLGGGVYMALLFASVAAFILITGGRIGDLPWRAIGLTILVAATSVSVYLLYPVGPEELTSGSAGVLGMGLGQMLLTQFAPMGAWLLVIISFCIGLMLTADNLVLKLPGFGRKVWDRRGHVRTVMGVLRPGSSRPNGRAAHSAGAPAAGSPTATGPAPPASTQARPRAKPARPGGPDSEANEDGRDPTEAKKKRARGFLGLPRLRPVRPKPAEPPEPPTERPEPSARQRPPAPAAADETDSPGPRTFRIPSTDLLLDPSGGYIESQEAQAEQKRLILQQTLNDFSVLAEVVGYMTGPVITLFELSLAPGVKVSQVGNLANDIARALAVPGVRIVSPLPGKDTVGIEVPNLEKEIVRIKELMQMAPDAESRMCLPLYLGKDAGGNAIVADLNDMPHLLIAGTTGSGKSVSINAIIMSMLLTRTPRDVRFILADPKMVEMAAFECIPHLLCPIVNDMRKAEEILEWAATKMDERYELLKEAGVKNVAGYNALSDDVLYERFSADTEEDRAQIATHLSYYVIVIDELADLMMTSGKEVETHVIRIAQKARAVGIHLVLATQRPSVNVVTGLIKSNMPCRISFRVASRQESRIVLDQNGADVLLGKGDMLFLKPGTSDLIRAQGTYTSDSEIRSVVKSLSGGRQPEYNAELVKLQSHSVDDPNAQRDELFDQAVEIVLASQRGSVSLLQRRLQVGYSRASRIIDQMAEAGLLGAYKGSQARECTMTLEEWQELKANIEADRSGASSANGEPTSV